MVTTERSCSEGKTICCEQFFTEPTVFGERRGPKTEEHSGLKTQGQWRCCEHLYFQIFLMQKCYHHISNKNTGTQKIMINGNI